MTARTMSLNVNLQGFGQRPAAWRTQDVTGTDLLGPRFWADLGRIAERGRLDAVFFADNPSLGNPNDRPLGLVEPFVALQAIGEATERLGLVGTASTTYNDPVELAERLLSLDVASAGRFAWNAVTTYNPAVSPNFGLLANPDRATRYRRAEEFVDVVRALWRSAATGEVVHHRGEFLEVFGRLDHPVSPQGHPVVFQAGGSPQGRDFAGRCADAVFAVELLLGPAITHYRQVTDAARRAGRDVRIVPGLSIVLGGTEAEARDRFDAFEALAGDPDHTLNTLGSYLDADLRGLPLDEPVPAEVLDAPWDPLTFTRSVGYRETVTAWVRQHNTSLRDLLRGFGGYGARIVVGTPEQVADSLQEWFLAGAADGFNLMIDEFPTGLAAVVEHVVPILQRRGLFRTDYEEDTLRERLARTGSPSRELLGVSS